MVLGEIVGLIFSCVKIANENERENRRQCVRYVQVPQQQVVMVSHHHPRQMCAQDRGYYPAMPGSAPSGTAQAQMRGYYPQVPIQGSTQQSTPHSTRQPHQQQHYVQVHPSNGQPVQAQQEASTSQTNSRAPRRRKPWQHRSKDGYSYTMMESDK